MPWDYRLIRLTDPAGSGRVQLQVRETWYDASGRPVWYAPRAFTAFAEIFADEPEAAARAYATGEARLAVRAFRRPVLDGARLRRYGGAQYVDFCWRFIYTQGRRRRDHYADSRHARWRVPLGLWRDPRPGSDAPPLGHPIPPDVEASLRALQREELGLAFDQKRLEPRTSSP